MKKGTVNLNYTTRRISLLNVCVGAGALVSRCCLGGDEVRPVSRLGYSHQLHTIFSYSGSSSSLGFPNTHGYTRTSQSLMLISLPPTPSREVRRRLSSGLRGFRPCLDLCKDAAESDGFHPSSPTAPTPTSAFVHLCNPFPEVLSGTSAHEITTLSSAPRRRNYRRALQKLAAPEMSGRLFRRRGDVAQTEPSRMQGCTKG